MKFIFYFQQYCEQKTLFINLLIIIQNISYGSGTVKGSSTECFPFWKGSDLEPV